MTDRRLITCREAERMYRLRHGTASAAAREGRIPAKRRGKAIYLSAKRAEQLWGALA